MSLAHWDLKEKRGQSLLEHSRNVAGLMEENCRRIGLSQTGRLIGLLHDAGKAKAAFQRYLLSGQTELKGKINHSACGAQLLSRCLFGEELPEKISADQRPKALLFQLCGIAVLGHHRGLMDIYKEDGQSSFERLLEAEEDHSAQNLFLSEIISQREIDQLIQQAQDELQVMIQKINNLIRERPGPQNSLSVMKENTACSKPVKTQEASLTLGLAERYLFSSLIDSDRLDSACFTEQTALPEAESRGEIWEELRRRLEIEIQDLGRHNPSQASEQLMKIRSRVSEACQAAGNWPAGIYLLQAITGSGKTLASLRLALQHACQVPETRHIIYVVPYLSILLQNARSIKEILHLEDHPDWLLEHYSDYANELMNEETESGNQEQLQAYELQTERWDSPLIITSLVHFLDTFYSARKKDVRRLHQCADSVIIFDEIQAIPETCISLFNSALNMLKQLAGVKVVLCSATLPPLDQIRHPLHFVEIRNIDCGYFSDMKKMNRIRLTDLTRTAEPMNTEKTAELAFMKLQERGSTLVIMNTIAGAQAVYEQAKVNANQIPDGQPPLLVLLTTHCCPEHKKQKIREVIQALKNRQPVLCVSTSLIEAGVDISFNVVMRACSGLDSLMQAAGRCNRHDHQEKGELIVFNSCEIDFMKESMTRNTTVSQLTRKWICTRRVSDQIQADPVKVKEGLLSETALTLYYQHYYKMTEDWMDYPIPGKQFDLYDLNSTNLCWSPQISEGWRSRRMWPMKQAFETAGRYFKVIDDYTVGVLVPYGKGKELIAELTSGKIQYQPEALRKLKRQAQNYSVNLSEHVIRKRKEDFRYYEAADLYILRSGCYDEEKGVTEFAAQSWII